MAEWPGSRGLGHSTPAYNIETGKPDGEMFLAQPNSKDIAT